MEAKDYLIIAALLTILSLICLYDVNLIHQIKKKPKFKVYYEYNVYRVQHFDEMKHLLYYRTDTIAIDTIYKPIN